MGKLQHLLESVIDEDEADEWREALLCKSGEILHQEAGISGHQDQAVEGRPQANPKTEL